ncbi:hypothetical protein TYRP_003653 [Tyrophagus putrescentiae]|nr:hypothetical protein TYRP_003653 [Tyrophagus putrescentiae]
MGNSPFRELCSPPTEFTADNSRTANSGGQCPPAAISTEQATSRQRALPRRRPSKVPASGPKETGTLKPCSSVRW